MLPVLLYLGVLSLIATLSLLLRSTQTDDGYTDWERYPLDERHEPRWQEYPFNYDLFNKGSLSYLRAYLRVLLKSLGNRMPLRPYARQQWLNLIRQVWATILFGRGVLHG